MRDTDRRPIAQRDPVEQEQQPCLQRMRGLIVEAIELENPCLAARLLHSLEELLEEEANQLDRSLETAYVKRIAMLIEQHGLVNVQDWEDDVLVELVHRGAFIDSHGDFLFIAPHAPRRSAQRSGRRLTAVSGRCSEVVVSGGGLTRLRWEGLMKDEHTLSFVPFIPCNCTGVFSDCSREYFIPGDMWRISHSDDRFIPSLLNVEGVRLSAHRIARHFIGAICDAPSARALTAWLDNPEYARRLIALEYLKHEYGHATGIGMQQRSQRGFFSGTRARRIAAYALDESRADGARSGFYEEYLRGADQERDLVAVTLVIRILDVIRAVSAESRHGLFEDVDILSTLKWFERMIEGGTLFQRRDGRLGLARGVAWDSDEVSCPPRFDSVDLLHVAEPMMRWSGLVEAEEKSCGSNFDELISTHSVGTRIIRMFEGSIVRPCRTYVQSLPND